MRRAAKVDANQGEIVAALRSYGCSVEHLHSVGGGVPDLLVGVDAGNLLMEVKDGAKPPSARKLTPDQVEWHGKWQGQVAVVKSVEEAKQVVDDYRRTYGQNRQRPSLHMRIELPSSKAKFPRTTANRYGICCPTTSHRR